MISGWGGFVISTVLTVFQLLSMFGIANELNMMVWGIGGMVLTATMAVAGAMQWWAYDNAYRVQEGSLTAVVGNAATGVNLMGLIEDDMLEFGAIELLAGFELYTQAENWVAYQMMQMCGMTEEEWKENCPEMHEKKGDKDMKEATGLFRKQYFGF